MKQELRSCVHVMSCIFVNSKNSKSVTLLPVLASIHWKSLSTENKANTPEKELNAAAAGKDSNLRFERFLLLFSVKTGSLLHCCLSEPRRYRGGPGTSVDTEMKQVLRDCLIELFAVRVFI